MDFEAWTRRDGDSERRKRLLAGYGVGAVGVSTVIALLSLSASGVAQEPPEEQPLEVQFAAEPEVEPEPEPEIDQTPEPTDPTPAPAPQVRAPVLPPPSAPTEIPKAAPEEVDVPRSDNPYDAADPYMYGAVASGPVTRPRVVESAPAQVTPPPAPPPPKGPLRITEDTTPPKPLSEPRVEYPPEAKAAGIEGTVVVKFVVTERGDTTQIQSIKGPVPLRAACEAVVRGMRFEPALRDGKPVSVFKTKPCRFRLLG